MRWYAVFGAGILAVIAGLVGYAAMPPVIKLDRAAPHLWIDEAATPQDRARVIELVAQAKADAAAALGSWQADPRWEVCLTPACSDQIPRGLSWHDWRIRIAPRGADDLRFYLHEAVHAELHNAAGLIGMARGDLPSWMDEGIAVLVSRTPGAPEHHGDCDAVSGISPPTTSREFARLAGPKGETAVTAYRISACATLDWLAQGNRIEDLTRRLRAGESFVIGATVSFDAPFGGYKISDQGGEHGDIGGDEFPEVKSTIGM